MPNVTNTLTATITTEEDLTGNVPINRGTGNPAFDCTVGEFVTYKQLPIGDTNPQLPITPTCQVYIKNLDAAAGITVHWTPNGQASALVCVLNPGDQIMMWLDPTKTLPGITALTLTVAAASSCEYFLGG